MELKKETWETVILALESEISELKTLVADLEYDLQKRYEDNAEIKKDLINKANEITNLKQNLNDYVKQEKIEDFIKQMGRRYAPKTTPYTNLTWESWFYILYPSADEIEYRKRGKAKEAIIGLLRSHELGFDNGGVIFRQH